MTFNMILVLAMLLLCGGGLIMHSIKAKRDPECGEAYWRNVRWAIGYAVVIFIEVCLSLDYSEPAAWHNWLAGGLFACCVAFFAYWVYKAFKK
jgi:succinate dehydrogenase hydrophobic anchor subunit